MEQKKNKRRFTVLDAVIILAVLAVVAFAGYKMLPSGSAATYETVELSFYSAEVPDFVAEQLYIGAPVIDADRNVYMGEVIDFKIEDSVVWSPNADGVLVQSDMDNYKAITVTTRVSGEPSAYGIRLSSVEYSVGHTIALRAGFAKFSCNVSAVVYDNPEVPQALAQAITG